MKAMKKNNYIRNNNNNVVRNNGVEKKTVNTVVKESKNEEKKEKNVPRVYKFPKLIFLFKVVAILGIVFAAVRYTDKKGLFEPDKNFHDAYMKSSFDNLVEKDTIDVCLFGNSHAGFSINTNILSNALGATCFTFYQGGSDMQDVYYCMKNVMQKTKIKVAVIETFAFTNVQNLDMEETQFGKKVVRTRDWDDNIKMEAMFDMLDLEQYLSVWSSTIRNHDFIFRDTTQMRKNANGYVKYKKQSKVYLGSTGQDSPGIGDSLDAVYDSLGARINGENISLNDVDEEYTKKIYDLCAENDTKILFVTMPMYYRNIENYDLWHGKLATLIDETKSKWLDLQLNYDSVAMKREYFENKRSLNQHILNNGMMYFTLRLAQFMNDSCNLNLLDRTKESRWREICYDTDGYFYFNSPNSNDSIRINICDNKKFGDKVVKTAYIKKGEKFNELYLMINKDGVSSDEISRGLKVGVVGKYKGNPIKTKIVMPRVIDVLPVKTHLFISSLVKDFELTEIDSIEF